MDNKEYRQHLKSIRACREAMEWSEPYGAQEAWDKCERGDWMLWMIGIASGDSGSDARKQLVLCDCECARLALVHVKGGELRPLQAIETAERWARGEEGVAIADVRAAAYAAADAYADAAAAAAASAARTKTLKKCAEIVRRHYPTSPALVAAAA